MPRYSTATNIVERAARAIARVAADKQDGVQAKLVTRQHWINGHWRDYLPEAQAALRAVRRPGRTR